MGGAAGLNKAILIKAAPSDPGSAGGLTGLRASVPVNSRQDAGTPSGTPLVGQHRKVSLLPLKP